MSRPHQFLFFLLLAFFNPLILLIGTSPTFIFVVPFTLIIWFAARWNQIARIEETSNLLEKLFGLGMYVSVIAYNMYRRYVLGIPRTPSDVGFGLIDMLIAFISVCIALYGFRRLQRFILPTTYIAVLIAGYQLEYTITEVTVLQNFLAHLMTSMLNILTMGASANGDIVTVYGRQGTFSLLINVDCTGLKGILAYGSLATLMLLDVKASYRRKALITAIGFTGTFILNIFRIFTIFVTIFFLGIDAGLAVHSYLGYSVFITWVLIFWTVAFKYLLPPISK